MAADLSSPISPLALASEFPAATEADWLKLVDGVLKGASFEKKLVHRTADGVAVPPLSPRRADATPLAAARGVAPWGILARLDHPDAHEANHLALAELEGGADMLALTFAGNFAARGFGLPDAEPATLEAALKGVHCDLIAIRLESAPFAGRGTAEGFVAFAAARRLPAAVLEVDFGFQPLADFAATNRWPASLDEMADHLAITIRDLQARGYAGPFIRCDSRPFHEAGASEGQELASILAQGVTYLRFLEARGFTLADAAGMLSFTLSADQDQLLTIAKFRAFRRLWAEVQGACGLPVTPIQIHAETSWRMMSRRDPHVNILRSTIAAFGAGIGGADSIGILPFTAALGLPDLAARRLARNTSLILTAESNLHRVIDPSAGAGGIEALTDGLATEGWAQFQRIEAERTNALSGLAAALQNGSLAARIADIRVKRDREIATRRMPITGTSEFPNITETPVEVLRPAPGSTKDYTNPLASRRLGEAFEALRDRADALVAEGRPPRVFLANLGRVADFTARTTFARNAFEAGGIAAIGNNGFAEGTGTDLVAMTDAFKASGARIACLCSSDAVYAEEAADAAMALMASGAEAIFLAGRPGEHDAALMAPGVSGYVYAGMDLPAFLAPLLG